MRLELQYGKQIQIMIWLLKATSILWYETKITVWKTNPDCDLVIKRLHLYYGMKLITFGIYNDKNLIVQFPVFI